MATTPRKVVRKVANRQDTAYVPNKAMADEYRGRRVAGVWDLTLADKARYEGENILLKGDTGTGKTMFGEAYAARKRLPYYSVPCDVSIDPSALFGKMVPTEEAGKFRFQYGPVTQIVESGGVLNLSEVNFMLPKIAASLYPLLDHRRYIPLIQHGGEIVKAHRCDDDCSPSGKACKRALLVIADMNPYYRGTVELNAAFQNRFKYKVDWNVDDGVEEELVNIPTILTIAKQLRSSTAATISTPVGTNALIDFENVSRDEDLGLDFAVANFVSGFSPGERSAVEEIFKLNRDNLEKDLAFDSESISDDDEDLEEWSMEDEGEVAI